MAFLVLLLLSLLGVNIWATRRVLRSDEYAARKRLFIAGIWIAPFFGALAVKDIGRADTAPVPDRADPEPDLAPAPVQLEVPGFAPFDVMSHLGEVNGVPLLDWQALDAWAASGTDDEARGHAIDQGRRGWLMHLRDSLGPHFHIHETPQAHLLTSLDERTAHVLLQYVATTRKRIDRVLHGIAHFPPGERSVLVVLDDEESYYHYVSTYYTQDGEFAFSGGMFINFGCPHFVAKRADLTAVEPVIAHEMTHSALAYLGLPTWLDEGIAVNTEHRLAGSQRPAHTPQQLQAMHKRFWDVDRIQEFWSGASFLRTDDGNMLSYELARILVDHMSRDWHAFVSFVSTAKRDDAGAQAADARMALDLGAWICALLEVPPDPKWSPAGQTVALFEPKYSAAS